MQNERDHALAEEEAARAEARQAKEAARAKARKAARADAERRMARQAEVDAEAEEAEVDARAKARRAAQAEAKAKKEAIEAWNAAQKAEHEDAEARAAAAKQYDIAVEQAFDATDDDKDAADVAQDRSYRDRIAILPGEPRVAYRPGEVVWDASTSKKALPDALKGGGVIVEHVFPDREDKGLGVWKRARNVADPSSTIEELQRRGYTAHHNVVYFASAPCCGVCPPHPSLAASIAANPWGANPWGANPWGANPWGANPWGANSWDANPWGANPWGANPWGANAETLNLVATGKAPTSSAMPAKADELHSGTLDGNGIMIGVLDSGLAGWWHTDDMRPAILRTNRVRGALDLPSVPMTQDPGDPPDRYLDPVAGHGTFIAGIIEQRIPGCQINVRKVFQPQGDVDVVALAGVLERLVDGRFPPPEIVNLSFGGTNTTDDGIFERHVKHYAKQGIVFVAAAGNEGSCVEQYPAALREVVGVGALGPTGLAPWSNYGPWVDASAPGADLVSSFFANFDGDLPPINGIDADNFKGWATWSGTSFAAPVVVSALAREMATTGCSAKEAVDRIIRAPHLARFPNMGTIVNY